MDSGFVGPGPYGILDLLLKKHQTSNTRLSAECGKRPMQVEEALKCLLPSLLVNLPVSTTPLLTLSLGLFSCLSLALLDVPGSSFGLHHSVST